MKLAMEKLRSWLLSARVGAGQSSDPLPTTRTLGEKFGVSNTTIYRELERAVERGELWKSPGGRYYFASQRSLVEKRDPVTCLIRKLENLSLVYRALMEGISTACTASGTPLLLLNSDELVDHPVPGQPPHFASARTQQSELEKFRPLLGNGRILLDHIWHEEVVAEIPGAFRLLTSDASASGIGCDWRDAAQQALAHLFGRGYEQIWPVLPFQGDPAIDAMLHALAEAGKESGVARRILPPRSGATEKDRATLLSQAAECRQAVALFSPEDHIARLLMDELATAAHPGQRPGILSGQGTAAAEEAGLSSLQFPWKEMGSAAVTSETSRQFQATLQIRGSTDREK